MDQVEESLPAQVVDVGGPVGAARHEELAQRCYIRMELLMKICEKWLSVRLP